MFPMLRKILRTGIVSEPAPAADEGEPQGGDVF